MLKLWFVLFYYSILCGFVCECILLHRFQKIYVCRWHSQSWVLGIKTKKIYIPITIDFNKILQLMKNKIFPVTKKIEWNLKVSHPNNNGFYSDFKNL